MWVLDLFCCAGGASEGYARAGFNVIGVDLDPQPNYPYPFLQADALEVLHYLTKGAAYRIDGEFVSLNRFNLIHASPPCQLFTMYRNVKKVRESTDETYTNLIPDTRYLLQKTRKCYVIENVPRAPLEDNFRLCGTSFGIPVRRHRIFETNWGPIPVPPCKHGDFTERRFPGSSNRPNGRTVCNVGEYRVPLEVQKECMTINRRVSLHELSEMVPPPYTEYIGKAFAGTC